MGVAVESFGSDTSVEGESEWDVARSEEAVKEGLEEKVVAWDKEEGEGACDRKMAEKGDEAKRECKKGFGGEYNAEEEI